VFCGGFLRKVIKKQNFNLKSFIKPNPEDNAKKTVVLKRNSRLMSAFQLRQTIMVLFKNLTPMQKDAIKKNTC
jgi:hypothetical protein